MSEREQLEAGLEQVKEAIQLGEAVLRLKKNRDFKKVFLDSYFSNEPQRLTLLLAAPNIKEEQRAEIIKSLQSISECHAFLQTVLSEYDRANEVIGEYEDSLAELAASEA